MNSPIATHRILRPLLVLAALAATSVTVLAQSPKYRPPPPPTKGTAFEFRLRYLLKPTVNFSGFGTIPFRDSYESEGNFFTGTERLIGYDDGFIAQDYIEATLIEGGLPNQEVRPSTNRDASSYFSYSNASQVVEGDGALAFHRYAASAGADEILEGSSNGSLGWELNYTKYINRKRNLGIQVGFSFNGFDTDYNQTIQSDLLVQEFIHQMADGATVPELPDPELDADGNVVSQDPYIGDRVQSADESSPLLEWASGEGDPVEEVQAGMAEINAQADFRSSVYNFRAGPTYTVSLGQKFGLQVGAGVSAVFYNGRFSALESLTNPAGGDPISTGFTTTESNEWQVGGYVDASANYILTDRVNLFSGMQFQSGSNYTQANGDRYANVDFNSQIYVHAGVGIKF